MFFWFVFMFFQQTYKLPTHTRNKQPKQKQTNTHTHTHTHTHTDENEMLGEYQHSFICFLMGQSLQGMEHWKHMTNLLCNCEDGLEQRIDLFLKFTKILIHQIMQLPKDFFNDELTSENFLNPCLQVIKSNKLFFYAFKNVTSFLFVFETNNILRRTLKNNKIKNRITLK